MAGHPSLIPGRRDCDWLLVAAWGSFRPLPLSASFPELPRIPQLPRSVISAMGVVRSTGCKTSTVVACSHPDNCTSRWVFSRYCRVMYLGTWSLMMVEQASRYWVLVAHSCRKRTKESVRYVHYERDQRPWEAFSMLADKCQPSQQSEPYSLSTSS